MVSTGMIGSRRSRERAVLVSRCARDGKLPVLWKLNGRQVVVLQLLEVWGFVTNGEVRRGLLQRGDREWCDDTIRRDLAAMVDAGVLVRRGLTKGTTYELKRET